MPFIYSFKRYQQPELRDYMMYVHVAKVLKEHDEFKTKPLQNSVQELHKSGIFPDLIIARSTDPLPDELRKKISGSCAVGFNQVWH
jgi:CTP synthase